MHELAKAIQEALAEAESVPPCMSLMIDEVGKAVELWLDTKAETYSEWIKGEGADISLMRDRETGKVVGCRLPLVHNKIIVSRLTADAAIDLVDEVNQEPAP